MWCARASTPRSRPTLWTTQNRTSPRPAAPKERAPLAAVTEVVAMLAGRAELAGVERRADARPPERGTRRTRRWPRSASGRTPSARVHHRDRGGRRRAGGHRDGRARRREVRHLAASPVARSSWPGARRPECVCSCLARKRARSRSSGSRALVATTDGFELAEKDVELRREGDVLGAAQSGRSSLDCSGSCATPPSSRRLARTPERSWMLTRRSSDTRPSRRPSGAWLEPEREEFLERA